MTRDTPRIFIPPSRRDSLTTDRRLGDTSSLDCVSERSILVFRPVAVAFARERLSLLHALGPALDFTKTSGNLTRTQKRVNTTSGRITITVPPFRAFEFRTDMRPFRAAYVPKRPSATAIRSTNGAGPLRD
jgi:hypothetical protein